MRFLSVLWVWLALVSPLRAGEPVATLPYRVDYGGWLTINAMVNGQGPYDFIIDTGSTITLAFANLHAQQNFAPTGRPPIRVLGISGAGELDTFVLGDVDIGAARLSNHIGVILPDWTPPRRTPHGIIGIDFLRRYAVYFDQRRRTMSLYEHGAMPDKLKDGLSRIKLEPESFGAATGALYTAHGWVNRVKTRFIIDLGSASTLINYKAAEAIFARGISRGGGEGSTVGSRLRDVFDDRTRARTALINKIRLGSVTWRRRGVWVYDAPIFEEINVQRLSYGLFGVDMLADRDFVLDFGDNELWVQRRAR